MKPKPSFNFVCIPSVWSLGDDTKFGYHLNWIGSWIVWLVFDNWKGLLFSVQIYAINGWFTLNSLLTFHQNFQHKNAFYLENRLSLQGLSNVLHSSGSYEFLRILCRFALFRFKIVWAKRCILSTGILTDRYCTPMHTFITFVMRFSICISDQILAGSVKWRSR